MKPVLILSFFAASVWAQHLAIGVVAGDRVTSQLDGDGTSESKPYLVGPEIELLLPRGFGVEFDALYSRFGYSGSSTDILGGSYVSRTRSNQWQFPLLLKYRLRIPLVHPYALVGWVPGHTSKSTVVTTGVQVDIAGNRTPVNTSYPVDYGTDHGLAAGGGVEIGGGHFRVAPEVRYIRWKDPLYSYYGSRGYYLQVPRNEVQILVGVTWR